MRLMAVIMIAALSAPAGTIEQRLPWAQIPAGIAGQKVKVAVAKGTVSGRLVRIAPEGLVVQGRRGERLVPRGEVTRIEATRRKPPKWAYLGAAIGAGASAPSPPRPQFRRRARGEPTREWWVLSSA